MKTIRKFHVSFFQLSWYASKNKYAFSKYDDFMNISFPVHNTAANPDFQRGSHLLLQYLVSAVKET